MKKKLPAKTLFQAKNSTYLTEKKFIFKLYDIQMNDIYWKRHTMIVAFQRMFGISEGYNNNQVTPSLSKAHELSCRSNIKFWISALRPDFETCTKKSYIKLIKMFFQLKFFINNELW